MLKEIKLESTRLVVDKIIKPTNAKFFKEIEEGDVLVLSYDISFDYFGKSYGGATCFIIKNETKDISTTVTHNNIRNRLQNFDLKIID